ISALATQLREWRGLVDDGPNCRLFLIKTEESRLVCSFRIEPRPTNWQFTSGQDRGRRHRVLPLDEIKSLIDEFLTEYENKIRLTDPHRLQIGREGAAT